MKRLALLAAASLCAGTAGAEDAGPGLFLFHVPVTGGAAAGAAAGRIEADLYVRNPAFLAAQIEGSTTAVLDVGADVVRVALEFHETRGGDPLPQHLQASFVVDFDEAPIASLAERLSSAHGGRPPIAALVEFVDASIVTKSYRRNFDFASRVAKSSEGDCTEHAVLLASLARATGRPARVVLGVMFLDEGSGIAAFGHAWAEIHDGDGWRIADATRPELKLPEARPRYLPLMELANEGPGFAFSLVDFAALKPTRIETRP